LQKKPAIKKALLLLREVQHSAKLYKFAQIASEIAKKSFQKKSIFSTNLGNLQAKTA